MGCCQSQNEEKQAPLLQGLAAKSDQDITKATGTSTAVESTQIQQKLLTAEADAAAPGTSTDTDSKQKEQTQPSQAVNESAAAQSADEKEEKQPVIDDQQEKQESSIRSNPNDAKDEAAETDEKQQAFDKKKTSALPGQCLIEQTFDLQKDLNTLQQKYKGQYQPLLKRNIVAANDTVQVTEDNSIKIMQFNMLADGLSTAYRWSSTEKTFLNVDPLCLEWTYRGLRLVEEILRFSPDVIALEECDQLSFLMKYLSAAGYASYFQQKSSSPIKHVRAAICAERKLESSAVAMDYDGVALIFKKSKFAVSEADIQYVDMAENKEKVFALAVPLKCVHMSVEEEILFVVTHLKSTKTAQGEQVRQRQINLLLTELVQNEKGLPVVLCCDLNANPVRNKKGYEALCYHAITAEDGLGFASAYKLGTGAEPEYTTLKLRQHGRDKHVLDYIFVKGGSWEVSALLDIPKEVERDADEEELRGLIPDWHYPSDHFSILAQLTWK